MPVWNVGYTLLFILLLVKLHGLYIFDWKIDKKKIYINWLKKYPT